MKVKKKYKIGDKAWIYGVSSGPGYNRPIEGEVIHELELDGFSGVHYIIAIPNEIETLLEIRTWENMSQDSKGPIGAFRASLARFSPARKVLARTGLILPAEVIEDDEESDDDNDQ